MRRTKTNSRLSLLFDQIEMPTQQIDKIEVARIIYDVWIKEHTIAKYYMGRLKLEGKSYEYDKTPDNPRRPDLVCYEQKQC